MAEDSKHRRIPLAMTPSFEETLIEVWRQTLVENAEVVVLGTERYPVRRTSKRGLRQVDFVFDGNEIRGLEQNPDTKSRWAQMARLSEQTAEAKLPPSSTSFLLPYICLYATICP